MSSGIQVHDNVENGIVRESNGVVDVKSPGKGRIKSIERDESSSDEERSKTNKTQKLMCSFPGCTVQTVFARNSDHKKHMDRHLRPYKCDRTGCDAPAFGDAGGLFRHQREVHKSRDGDRALSEYFCPDIRCERHTRGFPRRWNLMEHQRRIHGVNRDHSSSSYAISPDDQVHQQHDRIVRRPKRSQTTSGTFNSQPLSPLSSPPQSESPPRGSVSGGIVGVSSGGGGGGGPPSLPSLFNGFSSSSSSSTATTNGVGGSGGSNTTTMMDTGGAGAVGGGGGDMMMILNHHHNHQHGSGSGSVGIGYNNTAVTSLRVKLKQLEDRKSALEGENIKLGRDIEAVKHTLRVMEDGDS